MEERFCSIMIDCFEFSKFENWAKLGKLNLILVGNCQLLQFQRVAEEEISKFDQTTICPKYQKNENQIQNIFCEIGWGCYLNNHSQLKFNEPLICLFSVKSFSPGKQIWAKLVKYVLRQDCYSVTQFASTVNRLETKKCIDRHDLYNLHTYCVIGECIYIYIYQAGRVVQKCLQSHLHLRMNLSMQILAEIIMKKIFDKSLVLKKKQGDSSPCFQNSIHVLSICWMCKKSGKLGRKITFPAITLLIEL